MLDSYRQDIRKVYSAGLFTPLVIAAKYQMCNTKIQILFKKHFRQSPDLRGQLLLSASNTKKCLFSIQVNDRGTVNNTHLERKYIFFTIQIY